MSKTQIDTSKLAPCGYCRRCAIHDDPGGCLEVEAYEREMIAAGARWAILDATGECYALRSDYSEADLARLYAESYLDGAACSGHPMAAGWVRERLPIQIKFVSADEAEALTEEDVPVLDREP